MGYSDGYIKRRKPKKKKIILNLSGHLRSLAFLIFRGSVSPEYPQINKINVACKLTHQDTANYGQKSNDRQMGSLQHRFRKMRSSISSKN